MDGFLYHIARTIAEKNPKELALFERMQEFNRREDEKKQLKKLTDQVMELNMQLRKGRF